MSNKKMMFKEQQKSIDVVHFDSSIIAFNTTINRNPGIDIVFENISYSVEVADQTQQSKVPFKKTFKQKEILKNVSGIFKAGSCDAIMGASGAGKTTLLNILSCRIDPAEGGKLHANNTPYNYELFGDFANYVMQSDVLMQTLTVRETLIFAAKLKMNATEEEQKKRVIQLSNELKLEKCLDTLVGGVIVKGVSGGQRKRTSIAFELISDPQVIFLDEPTSGLDSLTSYIIVSELRKLAKRDNKTIIMTIHQPNSEIYELFDNLTLLLEGKIIYQDKAAKVADYFDEHFKLTCGEYVNPPDFVMSKIHYEDEKNRQNYPKYFQTYEKVQQQAVNQKIKDRNTAQVQLREMEHGFCGPILPLIQRNLLNVVRNPMLLRSKIFQGIFLSLYIGGLFFGIGKHDYTNRTLWNSITGFLFFMTISGLMSFLSPIILTFPSERQVFFKEQDSKMYGISQYFIARNVTQLPELMFIPLLMVSIYYFMIDMAPTAEQFFLHYLIFVLMGLCGSSLGLFLGSVVLDAKSVSAVVPIVMLPIILFSGFFKNRDNLPVWIGWIEYISPNKYAFTAYVENQVKFKDSLINNLHFDVSKWEAIGILFSLGIFFRILSMFFLWFLKKRMQ